MSAAETTIASEITKRKNVIINGLWHNNPALVQLLGLCPLLAVSNTAINGLSLGIATAFTVLLSNVIVSASRSFILAEIRIPVYVIIISGIVTLVGMLMNAFARRDKRINRTRHTIFRYTPAFRKHV